MRLTTRFSLSHSLVVVAALTVSFFLVYGGARLLYLRQARVSQSQELSDFALAARESLIQHEDVAVLNFMKSAILHPTLAYVAFYNPSTGTSVVLPPEYQKEKFTASETGKGSPVRLNRRGLEVQEWVDSIPLGEAGRGGSGWAIHCRPWKRT